MSIVKKACQINGFMPVFEIRVLAGWKRDV